MWRRVQCEQLLDTGQSLLRLRGNPIKGTGKTSSGASNIHLKINFTKQTYPENWHRRDFCVLSSFETIGEPILYMES